MGDDHTTDIDWDETLSEQCEMENFDWLDDKDDKEPNEILQEHIKQLVQECTTNNKRARGSGAGYKKQIYQMKCWIDEIYAILPIFEEEKDWEKERVFDKLKGTDNGNKK